MSPTLVMAIALGVMARAPVAGACKTRLTSRLGPAGAASLYLAMLQDTIAGLERIDAARRLLLATPDNDGVAHLRSIAPRGWDVVAQRGDGLSERLEHALAILCAGGMSAVILGSDSPILPFETMASALSDLNGADHVLLGPALDGGYYLIGMSSPRPELFADMPWSTDRVAAVTRERCARLGLTLTELPECYDVDVPADLDRLADDLAIDATRAPHTAAWLLGSPDQARGRDR